MAQATTLPTDATVQTSRNISSKDNILSQIKSLDDKDDVETSICKRVSWILRRGASKVGVKQDPMTSWVKFADLCACAILKEFPEELIWKVVKYFNAKKPRYQISEEDGRWLRACKQEGTEDVSTSSQLKPQDPQQVLQWSHDSQQQAMQQVSQQLAWNYMWPMMMPWNPLTSSVPWRGRVKSINAEKGFGFIENQYIHTQYHRDVFLRKDQLGDLQVGEWVQFSFELNQQQMPQAREVVSMPSMLCAPPAPPAEAVKGKGGTAKGKGGKGRGKGGGRRGKFDGGTKCDQGEINDHGDKENKEKLEQSAEEAGDVAKKVVL